ncbi:MAG: glycosyltransferase family 4 protein [Solirubrobacteraceae bacterium]
MRVLLISWEYPPLVQGGLGRHVHKLSEQLAASGVELQVLTRGADGHAAGDLDPAGPGSTPAEEVLGGVRVHRVREPPFTEDLDLFLGWVAGMNRDLRALGEMLCARARFDLVHSHDWLVADAAGWIARAAAIPWLVTVHATEFGRHQGWVREHPQSDIHAAERAMALRADRLITCSDYMRRHVAEVFGVPPTRITAIPNGIDPSDLEHVEGDLPALRARYARPSERLVLMVGRLMFEKGFHLALDALAAIVAGRCDVRFVIAGGGMAEGELRHQAQRLGLTQHGSFLGPVSDELLHSLYRVADVCVVPSLYEPFGLVALEAMVSGCACVVAGTGGLREIVSRDGSVGLRFSAGDSQSLRVTLERVLADDALRARLAARAREYVARFDWVEVARQTRDVYDSMCR